MSRSLVRPSIGAVVLLLLAAHAAAGDTPSFPHGVVATVHAIASRAGAQALRDGGNAVDAAVVAGLVLGVVDGHNSGLGGGCLMLVRGPDGTITAIDGRETAPAAATRGMFLRDGRADAALSRTGPLAVATPGQVAAFHDAVASFGRLPWTYHCSAASRVAAEGFTVSPHYRARVAGVRADLARDPGAAAAFLGADGEPPDVATVLRQPDLAQSLAALGEEGPAWFYRGPFAERAGAWMAARGGILTAADFAAYRSVRREPVRSFYRGRSIVGFPPPSSGGIHVAQILGIVERSGPGVPVADEAAGAHVVAEAMKRAFADRAHWLGDADRVPVPRGLLDGVYLADLAAGIDPARATAVAGHGTPPRAESDLFPPASHTTHVSAADADGWWVACTSTVNTAFGAKVMVPGTGIILNNEMDDFVVEPGMRNAFGLVGGEANAIAPGKRPLSSMAPTLVLEGDRPVMALGAAGGPTIISQVVLAVVRSIDGACDPVDALAAPRFHHQWSPDRLRVEASLAGAVVEGLRSRGHHVEEVDSIGAATMVARPHADGPFTGAADPRLDEGAIDGR